MKPEIAALIGALAVISGALMGMVGQLLTSKLEHKRNLERLKERHKNRINYMKEESFFQKKLEYFEEVSKITENLAEEVKSTTVEFRKDKPNIKKLEELSQKKKEIKIEHSMLYYDNVPEILKGIISLKQKEIKFRRKVIEVVEEAFIKKQDNKEKLLSELEEEMKSIAKGTANLGMLMRKELLR